MKLKDKRHEAIERDLNMPASYIRKTVAAEMWPRERCFGDSVKRDSVLQCLEEIGRCMGECTQLAEAEELIRLMDSAEEEDEKERAEDDEEGQP